MLSKKFSFLIALFLTISLSCAETSWQNVELQAAKLNNAIDHLENFTNAQLRKYKVKTIPELPEKKIAVISTLSRTYNQDISKMPEEYQSELFKRFRKTKAYEYDSTLGW